MIQRIDAACTIVGNTDKILRQWVPCHALHIVVMIGDLSLERSCHSIKHRWSVEMHSAASSTDGVCACSE
jgi:hypothetical protein